MDAKTVDQIFTELEEIKKSMIAAHDELEAGIEKNLQKLEKYIAMRKEQLKYKSEHSTQPQTQ